MNNMAERIETGGMKSFSYGRNQKVELDKDRKEEIAKGYEEFYGRREMERKKKTLAWSIVIIVILIILVFLILRFT